MANNHHNGRRKWYLLAVASVIVIGGGIGIAAALHPNNTIDPSKLSSVTRGDLARSVVATGKIEPLVKVEVKSRASGIVERILADYGDHVKAGQVLVELDKEQLSGRVAEAQANLQAAQAAVESAQATYERNKVDAEGPDLPFLKSSVDRNRKLAADGLVSSAVLDDSDREYRLALNKQVSAQRYLAVSRAEIARNKAQVAQMQAELDSAEEDLRNSTIVSPMDGLVLSRDVEVGDAVSSILILGSSHAGDDPGRRQRGLRQRQSRRGRHRQRLPGPTRPHHGRILQQQNLRGQSHQDFPHGRGKGQRHHL